MNVLRKKLHKTAAIFMALVLIFSLGMIVPARADSLSLADGYYQAILGYTDWSGSSYAYSGINVSDRALLIKSSSGYMLQFQINSYSTYEAIYMVKQSKNADVTEIDLEKGGKIGTDWTGSDGNELTDYSQLIDGGYADESLNECFTKLTPSSVDSVTDTAVFNVVGINPDEKIGLVGYHPQSWSTGMLARHCSSVTVWVNPDNLKSTQLLYVPYGYASPELYVNFSRVWGNTSYSSFERADNWENEAGYTSAVFNQQFIDRVEYSVDSDNSVVQARIYVKEEYRDSGMIVNVAVSRTVEGVSSDYYDAYIAGNRNITWSENLYNSDNGCISITLDSNALLYGKMIRISTTATGSKRGMVATLYLSDSYYNNNKQLINQDYGIIIENTEQNLPDSVQLDVTVDTNVAAVESIQKVADENDYIVYTLNLKKNGSDYNPRNRGTIKVPIPESYTEGRFYAEVTYTKNNALNTYLAWPGNMEIAEENGQRYLMFQAKQEILNGGNIAIAQINTLVDVSNLEPGIYKTEVNFLKAGTEAQTSMASGCLDKEAYLVVSENGDKEVYLNFHGLILDETAPEDKAYMGALYNSAADDSTYFDYETDENGVLLDNSGFDALTEFPCVKSVKIKLDDSTYENNKYSFWVIPPAMGSGQPFEEIYNDPIAAEFVFYSAEKVDDSIELPAYQKSILRRSIDKAKLYEESSYSADSWAELETALADGENYYNSLTGDAGTDLSISEMIKAKSDAIETALNNLEENNELADTRETLSAVIKQAQSVTQGDKTDTAFHVLQTAIDAALAAYNRPNITVEELNQAKTTLEEAVEVFKNSDTVSVLDKNNLEDGIYSVNVDMIKTDRQSRSMSDNAINHIVKLEVINGEYFITLDFQGITIENRFGYLKNLSYYEEGYTYGTYGTINGTLSLAEILSTQKDTEGNDIIDQYNDENNLYPDIVRIKVVPSAIADENGYVPLHVFVPIMEAIAEGNGDQDVLMRIDWTTLKETTEDDPGFQPEEPVEQSPEVDLTDTATGVNVHADKGVFEEGVQLSVTGIISGTVYNNAVTALSDVGEKFNLYNVRFIGADGTEVSPNGTVTIRFPVASDWKEADIAVYRINDDGSKTLVKGSVSDGYYSIITKTGATYAVVEKGSVVSDGTKTDNDDNKANIGTQTGSNPKTGDESNRMMCLILMISAGILGVIMIIGKRNSVDRI